VGARTCALNTQAYHQPSTKPSKHEAINKAINEAITDCETPSKEQTLALLADCF
jgi:hypothetical protein